jgi:hypothetical protein
VIAAAIGVVLAVGDTSGSDEPEVAVRIGPMGADLTLHF